jgi:hypothetical protein
MVQGSYLMETSTTSDTLLTAWYRTTKLSSGGAAERQCLETFMPRRLLQRFVRRLSPCRRFKADNFPISKS